MIPKNKYSLLWIVTSVLILLNIFVIALYGLEESRHMRLFSTLTFTAFIFFKRKEVSTLLLLVFLLFIAQDVGMLYYENLYLGLFSLLMTLTAYLCLIKIAFYKLKFSKINIYIVLFAGVLIALNFFSLYTLTSFFEVKLQSNLQIALIYVYGIVLIALGITAFLYNDTYIGKPPLLFLFCAFCFIISDIAALPAYYMDFTEAYFPDRVFYLLGLALLCNYSWRIKNNHGLLQDKFSI